jgi:hypothetical protein
MQGRTCEGGRGCWRGVGWERCQARLLLQLLEPELLPLLRLRLRLYWLHDERRLHLQERLDVHLLPCAHLLQPAPEMYQLVVSLRSLDLPTAGWRVWRPQPLSVDEISAALFQQVHRLCLKLPGNLRGQVRCLRPVKSPHAEEVPNRGGEDDVLKAG